MTEEQIANQKAAQEKLAARIAELQACVGKTYKPKNADPRHPNKTVKILKYNGVGRNASGQSMHLFSAESSNPGAMWTPPATEFLNTHEEVEPKPETATPEII